MRRRGVAAVALLPLLAMVASLAVVPAATSARRQPRARAPAPASVTPREPWEERRPTNDRAKQQQPSQQPSQQRPSQQQPSPQEPTKQEPAKQEPSPKEKQQPKPPADPTRSAAEILRQRLGLQPGPAAPPPPGPQQPQAPPTEPPQQRQPPPEQPQQDEREKQQDPPPQDPPTQDPTDRAADALRRLLPRAKPPEVAPIPTAQGTPEPVHQGMPVPLTAEPTQVGSVPLSGSLGLAYRGRHGDGKSDQDLIARLRANVGDPTQDPVTFHLASRGYGDLDGRRRDDPFAGLDESLSDWHARLYEAHVDVHRQGPLERIRLGRQELDEAPLFVTFDGARVDSVPFAGATRAWLSAYGGATVHHFEASRRGDAIVGGAFGFLPWHRGRVRFDAVHLRDDVLTLDESDTLLGASWWQGLGPLQLHGVHTWRDGRPRDLDLGARGDLVGWFEFDVDYRELLTTQRHQVTELDPFFAVLAEEAPFRQVGATLRRAFGEHVDVALGFDLRRLHDRSDAGAFNREFERLHADVVVSDVGWRGLSVSVTGSSWDATGEDFRTLTGEVAWQRDRGLRLALGSGYDLFRFDELAGRERLRVRTYYLRADVRLGAGVQVGSGYEHERDDDTEFHLFRLGVTWTF